MPKLAHAKADHEWNRPAVESTVRSWYRHLSISTEVETMQVKREWEERFAQLPPGGDTEQLPAMQKLVWQDLPKFVPTRGIMCVVLQ